MKKQKQTERLKRKIEVAQKTTSEIYVHKCLCCFSKWDWLLICLQILSTSHTKTFWIWRS